MKNITVEYIENKIIENEPMYKKFFDTNECAYAILQLPIESDYKFRDFEFVTRKLHKVPCRDDYKLLYANIIDPTKTGMMSSKEIAELIYSAFNAPNRPNIDDNYFGTSVSVSDVIVIKCGNYKFAFYVNDFGFETLVNFEV